MGREAEVGLVEQVMVWARGRSMAVEGCVFGCGLVTLVSYHTMVWYDEEPKPGSNRSPEGRAGPVFITVASHAICFCYLL